MVSRACLMKSSLKPSGSKVLPLSFWMVNTHWLTSLASYLPAIYPGVVNVLTKPGVDILSPSTPR